MKIKSIFRKFAYWDRVHQFQDGCVQEEKNLAWRKKYLSRKKSVEPLTF